MTDTEAESTPALSPRAALRFQIGLLALAVLLFVAATGYSASTVGKVRSSVDWVSHTQELQAALQGLRASIYNVEIYGLRYLLSQRGEYLQAHVQAMQDVEQRLQALGRSVENNTSQLERLVELRGLVRARDEHYRAAVGEAQAQGLAASSERIRGGRGAELLDRMQATVEAMQREEARLLARRQAELDAVLVQSTATVLLVNALALALGAVALFSLRRGARARAAEELAQVRAEEAERASREKSRFLASMSHEIRTPMNAVFGFSQLLARTRIEPQARDYIHAIQTSGRALLALINDILDLSKIEAGRLDLHPQRSDLRELVDSTLTVFGESARQKGLKLRARISPALPASLWLDPHRLRQVLSNLVSNAVKYTDSGNVLVHAEARPRDAGTCDVLIEVRDTGPGIAPAQQAEIFEPFQRAVEEADSPQGSGLGLAIVRRLLALMDGEISLDSTPGHGSCFRVLLRGVVVAAGPVDSDSAAEPEVDFASLKPSRILIVDDVAWNRELLAAFLGEAGHPLAFARHGAEALEQAERFQPELVLMDLRMPVMDGREATRRLREWDARRRAAAPQQPELKVVAVSASSMAREERAVRGEFEAYLRKPVTREQLHGALARLLPARAATDAGATASAASAVRGSEAVDVSLLERERVGGAESAAVRAESAAGLDPQRRSVAEARLRALRDSVLPGLQQSLRVSEVQRFSEELAVLAADTGQRDLGAYARRLSSAVERFDVVQMDSLLHQFEDHAELPPAAPPPTD